MPGNGQEGITPFPPQKTTGSVVQLKYICTNACSMGNNKEELEAIVQQENHDIREPKYS